MSLSIQAKESWYSVEYILFEHRASTVQDQEPWSGNPTGIPDQVIHVLPASVAVPEWTTFRPLSQNEMSLAGARRALNKSVTYRVLAHAGWIQSLIEDDSTPQPVLILVKGIDNQVQGTLTFRRGRFLHLDVDLTLSESPAYQRAYGADDSSLADVTRFRSQQTRRIRTEELHYFDHPRFGVLVKVLPLTPPEPATPAPQPQPGTDVNNPAAAPAEPKPAAE